MEKKIIIVLRGCPLETVTDFLIELGMKPCMHLVEISIFSLNNVTDRLNKIMNNLLKDLKILIFKVIFQCWKLVESFQIKFSLKNIGLSRRPSFFDNFGVENVPNFFRLYWWFGRSDDDLILRKNTYFHYMNMWFQKSWFKIFDSWTVSKHH